MNDMKLKPAQKRLWRRVYLAAFDAGASNIEAMEAADFAVKQWESRGAFDESHEQSAALSHAQAWSMIAAIVREKHPTAFDAVLNMLAAKEPVSPSVEPVAPVTLSDSERLVAIRGLLESGTREAKIDGVPVGVVKHWATRLQPDSTIMHLVLTVESTFSLID